MIKTKWQFPLAVGAAGALAGAWAYKRFRRDLRDARERVSADGSVVQTACGPIEVGEAGFGTPILGIHGAAGGYDQCLLLGRLLFDRGYRVIAPSRFGYLNTPIPKDSSIEAQADAHACLLDVLHVDRVAVVAISAGGPSGLHFALRHPERMAALLLVSAISYGGTSEAEVRWYRTRHSLARENDIEFILMQRNPGGYRSPTPRQRELGRMATKRLIAETATLFNNARLVSQKSVVDASDGAVTLREAQADYATAAP